MIASDHERPAPHALELRLVTLVAEANWPSFRVERIRVTSRECTGVGKFVYLDDPHDQHLPDGFYSWSDGRVEMSGIPAVSCSECSFATDASHVWNWLRCPLIHGMASNGNGQSRHVRSRRRDRECGTHRLGGLR